MNRDRVREVRQQNADTLVEFQKTTDEALQRHIAKFDGRYAVLKEQLRSLQSERTALCRHPVSKEEFLEKAKEQLQSGKDSLIERLVREMLAGCQQRNALPFNITGMRLTMFPQEKAWELFFLACTEEHLEKAVAQLPDIGISTKDREAKLKELDAEISRIMQALKDDLESLK